MDLTSNNSDAAQRLEDLTLKIEQETILLESIQNEMSKVIIGQKHMISRLLIALLSEGHILLEGVPGLAKTLAINTLSQIIDGKFQRIQFTPDLLPADITGTMIYSPKAESFSVKKGPLFSNFILADEINRAPAKVQSALLEAMQERQITIGEETFPLPTPFLVMATQNPIDQEGTYNLPEAQVDRFMLKVNLTYPSIAEEQEILAQEIGCQTKKSIVSVCNTTDIMRLRDLCSQIYIDPKIQKYIVDIVYATRVPQEYGLSHLVDLIEAGASPRASINIAKAAKALAFLRHRSYVIPEDVKAVAHDVLVHRILISFEGEAESLKVNDIIDSILASIEVP